MTDRFAVDPDGLKVAATSLVAFQEFMRDSLACLQTVADGLPWEGSANERFRELFQTAHANVSQSVEATSDVAAILTTARDNYLAASDANTAGWGGGKASALSV